MSAAPALPNPVPRLHTEDGTDNSERVAEVWHEMRANAIYQITGAGGHKRAVSTREAVAARFDEQQLATLLWIAAQDGIEEPQRNRLMLDWMRDATQIAIARLVNQEDAARRRAFNEELAEDMAYERSLG